MKEDNTMKHLNDIEEIKGEEMEQLEDNIIQEHKAKENNVKSNNPSEQSIDRFFEQLEESEAADLKSEKDNSTRNTLIIVVAAILILSTLAFMYLYWKSDSTTSSKTGVNVTISGDSGTQKGSKNKKEDTEVEDTDVDEEDDLEDYEEQDEFEESKVKEKNTKVVLEDWEKVSKSDMTDKQKEKMLEKVSESTLGEMFVGMPSAAEGFTSNREEMVDEDYVPNPYYVDLTKEEFIEQYNDIIMRITNPIYGEWEDLQLESKEKIDTKAYYAQIFKGVSDGELISNTKSEERSPMMFDYDANGFAAIYDKKQIDKNGARIVGKLTKGDMLYESEDRMVSDITVTYYLPDGSSFDRDMKLGLKINEENKLILTSIKSN